MLGPSREVSVVQGMQVRQGTSGGTPWSHGAHMLAQGSLTGMRACQQEMRAEVDGVLATLTWVPRTDPAEEMLFELNLSDRRSQPSEI